MGFKEVMWPSQWSILDFSTEDINVGKRQWSPIIQATVSE